jgi:hypothetical protein
MKRLSGKSWRILILTILSLAAAEYRVAAASYVLPIEYKQIDLAIVLESQVQGWPAGYETYDRGFWDDIEVSGDGSKIAFWVNVATTGAWRLFIANADGTGLTDITSLLPATWPRQLLFNHDGSKLYGGGGESNWYCDIAGGTGCSRAVFSGIWSGDGRKPFTITTDGSQLFFKHDDAYPKPDGLYSAVLGGVPSPVLDRTTLHCDSNCDDTGLLRFLGSSRSSGRMFFTFDRDWYGTTGPPYASTAMFYVSAGSGAVRIPDEEHDYVWDQQNLNNELVSADGSRALYYYMDSGGSPQLHWVNVATGAKTLIAEVNPSANTTISADGKLVLLTSGSRYRVTRMNLETPDERDTGSYFIPNSYDQWIVSGLTVDKRYYYNGASGASQNYLRKVDMKPTDFSHAPNISTFTCSVPALIHADGVTAKVTVQVSDAQGLENIDWVNLSVLVEGREEPSWPMGRAPLAFPFGDPGSTRLYDDGTHGDEVAGDGIFTFDGVATRKGDYDGWNTWYTHFTLPHAVGLRIIAKDKDENYTLADTRLTIAQIFSYPETLVLRPGEVGRSTIFGAASPYSVQSSNPAVAQAQVDGDEVVVTAGHAGTATLTITDAGLHTVTLSVTVHGRGMPYVPLLLLD